MISSCFHVKNIIKFVRYNKHWKKYFSNLTVYKIYKHQQNVSSGATETSTRTSFMSRFESPFTLTLLTTFWYQLNEYDEIEDNVAHLVALAKLALEKGDVERAREILHLGLRISEEHKLYAAVTYLYDIIATVTLNQGNVKEVEDLMITAIEKLSAWGYPDNHYNIVDFKLRLSRIYSATGNNGLAKLGFETCLNQQQAKILAGDTSEKTGMQYVNVLFWYGVHLMNDDRHAEAKEMIRTAYDFSTKIKLLTPKQEMVILYTLADVSAQLSDLEVALTSMLDAIILAKGIGSADTPFCYLKLGGIYEKMGFPEKARFAYDEAMRSARVFGFHDIVLDAENAARNLDTNKAHLPEE